jgi:hypothetical protein
MITNIITQVAGQQQPVAVTTIVKCEREGCEHEISFDQSTKEKTLNDNLWLRSYRTVQTGDARSIGYCSDICELKGIETGKHNIPEAPKIVPVGNSAAVAAAAAAAANAKAQDAAIRSGQPAKVQLTD